MMNSNGYIHHKSGKHVVRTLRPKEIDQRKRVVAAVHFANENNIPLSEASKRLDVPWPTMQEAATVLQYGTPEQIAKLEEGTLSIRYAARTIRKTVLDRPRRSTARGKEARAMMRDDALLYQKLRDALENIAALPSPADIIAVVRRSNLRTQTVQKNLSTAYSWIEEFADAWTK